MSESGRERERKRILTGNPPSQVIAILLQINPKNQDQIYALRRAFKQTSYSPCRDPSFLRELVLSKGAAVKKDGEVFFFFLQNFTFLRVFSLCFVIIFVLTLMTFLFPPRRQSLAWACVCCRIHPDSRWLHSLRPADQVRQGQQGQQGACGSSVGESRCGNG